MKDFIEGYFIEELKTRFLCNVKVNDEIFLCYVPISCKLSKLIELKNNNVLLVENNNLKSKTKISLLAIESEKEYIIINTFIINKIIKEYLHSIFNIFTVKSECLIDDYKSDFYIDEQKLIIETKTVLSNDTILKFPNINSQRSIVQLRKLKKLINKGYKVEYIFISLTSNLNQFVLNKNTEYVCLLKQCIELGMVFKIWKLSLNNSVFSLDTNPNIIFRYS